MASGVSAFGIEGCSEATGRQLLAKLKEHATQACCVQS